MTGSHAANLSEYHGETHSYNWEVLSERFGQTYQPADAMRVRILGGEVSDTGEALYLIQHEDGTLGYKAVDSVDDWEPIDVDEGVFPPVPDRAKENGFGVID